MPTTATPAPADPPQPAAAPAAYVPLPQRLITDLHDTPLALGLYALVGRLFLVGQAPIPLSVPDVLRFDPTLSRGAVLRALARLVRGGWLVEQAQVGRKTRYTPAWGRVNGAPVPWRMGQPCLGRPRHVARLRLDRQLLDTCMGKLAPHPTRAAAITRYLTIPALALADIGGYALTLAGLPHATPGLRRLGLVRDDLALPLPAAARLLALISQRALALDDVSADLRDTAELTPSGARKLGLGPLVPPRDADEAAPLFFVPPRLIGMLIAPMIGSLIGADATPADAPTASQGHETACSARVDGITWGSKNIRDEEIPPPTPPAALAGAGGAMLDEKKPTRSARRGARMQRSRQPQSPPDTASARALQALQVRPEQVAELAHLPLAVVEAAIAHGRARDTVRDLAGWVVSLLRAHRDHGWPIPAPAPRPDAPEALRESFRRYAAAQEAAPPDPAADHTAAALPPTPLCDPPCLWDAALARLQAQIPRREYERWLRGTALLAVTNNVATISAPSLAAKEAIEGRYLGLLRAALAELAGQPLTVRVRLYDARPAGSAMGSAGASDARTNGAAEEAGQPREAGADDARPEWIAPARWAALPTLLRAALRGATLEAETVRTGSPHLDRLIRTRYARELAALVAASSP